MIFTLTVTPENSVQEKELVNLGFEQQFDNSPYTFEGRCFGEVAEAINEIEAEVSELEWVLEKAE